MFIPRYSNFFAVIYLFSPANETLTYHLVTFKDDLSGTRKLRHGDWKLKANPRQ